MPDTAAIDALHHSISQFSGYSVFLACELEFYLDDADSLPLILERFPSLKKEDGLNQHEIILEVNDGNPVALAQHIEQTRASLIADFPAITFAALPYPDQPGNSMHINISLHDAAGTNVFYKRDDEMSQPLSDVLGGLLTTMQDNMPAFAPTPESFKRFRPKQNAPTHICWGGNNRTVALRLPDSKSGIKHIEHRVPGADANPYAVVEAILKGILHGLTHHPNPGKQIYGNAFLDIYELQALSA